MPDATDRKKRRRKEIRGEGGGKEVKRGRRKWRRKKRGSKWKWRRPFLEDSSKCVKPLPVPMLKSKSGAGRSIIL